MENWRHKVYNFAMDTLNPKYLLEKLDVVFDFVKRVATLNVALGFVLKNVEDGSFWCHFAHEKNTPLERYKLVSTAQDLTKSRNLTSNTDVIKSCTKERANTKCKFYKLTNVTIVTALLREVPLCCKDIVLSDTLLKKLSVNCLTLKENTRKPRNDKLCLSRAFALHLHGTWTLRDENSKSFNLLPGKTGGIHPAIFRGVCMEYIAVSGGYC